jgi:hypothetical protein
MQEVTESMMRTFTDFKEKIYQMLTAEEAAICTTKEVIFEEIYEPDESTSLHIKESEKEEDFKVSRGRASLGTPRFDPYDFSKSEIDDDGEFDYIFEKKDPEKGNCFSLKEEVQILNSDNVEHTPCHDLVIKDLCTIPKVPISRILFR